MEIIRIGENKLKLILTDEDLLKYHLKFESLHYDNTEMRRILWTILDEAKKKTGFDAAAERTLVQTYPGRKGGCEIYVTRQAEEKHGQGGNLFIYRFTDADAVFSVCRLLSPISARYESMLYRACDATYYLVLYPKERASEKENLLSPLSFIEEYAQRIKSSGALSYIKEHASLWIPSKAVERLEKFTHACIKE